MDLFTLVKDSLKVLVIAFLLLIAGVWAYYKSRPQKQEFNRKDKLQHLRKRAVTAVKESERTPVKTVTLGGMEERFAPRPLSHTQMPLRRMAQASQVAVPARFQVLNNRGSSNRPN